MNTTTTTALDERAISVKVDETEPYPQEAVETFDRLCARAKETYAPRGDMERILQLASDMRASCVRHAADMRAGCVQFASDMCETRTQFAEDKRASREATHTVVAADMRESREATHSVSAGEALAASALLDWIDEEVWHDPGLGFDYTLVRELTALLHEAAGDRRSASQIRELVEWCYEQNVMTAVEVPENLLGDGVCTLDDDDNEKPLTDEQRAWVRDYVRRCAR